MLRLLILLFLFPVSVVGQDRVDRKNVEWAVKSKQISTATGWKHNRTTGKWVSNKNAVHDNPVLAGMINYLDQCFNWIQIAKVKNEYESYTLLLYEKPSGFYEYEEIKRGWIDERRTYWILIDSVQYADLKQLIQNKSAGELTITSNNYGYIRDVLNKLGGQHEYSESNLLANITNGLRLSEDTKKCLKIKYPSDSKGDLVKFLLPESCRYVDRNFENEYFEVTQAAFSVLLAN
jgi:hypothetical protein